MKTPLKRMASLFLALVMIVTMLPTPALADEVSDSLVTSLAAAYDGDEARAREELEALHGAGIIDADGQMVPLDVREDGERVELDAVAQRIAGGESVGALTVNGNAAAPEQLLQIQQVKGLLDVVRLMDEDVEITDEHIANLQSLLEGIADGSIDLVSTVESGTLALNAAQYASLMSADDPSDTRSDSGELDADMDQQRPRGCHD